MADQFGLEKTPEEYTNKAVAIFREVRRVLRSNGTLWLNLGDSYASQGGPQVAQTKWQIEGASDGQNGGMSRSATCGLKPKDLVGIPWRVAFALQADGWYLRSEIIWHKPNPMPESVTDRPTKAHEQIFLLSKSERYYYDAEAIAEPSLVGWNGSKFDDERDLAVRPNTGRNRWQERKDLGEGSRRGFSQNQPSGCGGVGIGETRNKRSVWTVATRSFTDAHFATFPPALIEPCILAGCPEDGTVLDPFNGAGTTGLVSLRKRRNYIGIELKPEYVEMSRKRIMDDCPMFNVEVPA